MVVDQKLQGISKTLKANRFTKEDTKGQRQHRKAGLKGLLQADSRHDVSAIKSY